ncbi:MAG: lysozyme inhibitor LprI family protein [Thiomonas sp.]
MRWQSMLCTVLLTIGGSGLALAATAPVQPPSICRAQPDSAACAAQTRHALNVRMRHLYRLELQKVMGTYAERRLDHAQNLWRRWVNADCLFRVGPHDRGGPQWQTRMDACQANKIRSRITELDRLLHCEGDTCPPR